jgi:peptidoglycan hydrolase CwlO-like protein
LGGNKTGKSSIIKSIFTTLGCECKRVEADWKKLVSTYLLFFKYGERQFCIVRQDKKFQIFENINNDFSCIIETNAFHEYSNCLMDILEIKMPCISKDGKQFNITPPLLFRFQYIDQDEGWSKIADSFKNVAYIKDWKANTNKYVCGYLDDSYYALQAQKAEHILERDDKKKELNYNQNFVSRITSTLTRIEDIESVEDVTTDIELLLAKAEELRKLQFSYNAEMTVLENDIYINQHKLHIVEHNLIETKKDIEYAMTQEDELICPFCGTIYSNGINEQLNITSDYAHCENLIAELKSSISVATKELEELKNKYNDVSVEIQSIEQKVQNTQELLSYSSFYKSKGQFEIYESCKRQLDVLQGEINSCVSKIAITDEKINEKKSKERSKDIREDIERYCRTLADAINVPKTFIKLRDFVQVINRTGSETPRLVYMYQSALYLYNLERAYSPFNFYVVDTPNQQGQDTENLGSIFKSLELFLSDEGQVIVGTERETGMEEKASNVIKLTGKRRCLNNINYKKHIELLEKLQKTAISWVADNHNIQNEI